MCPRLSDAGFRTTKKTVCVFCLKADAASARCTSLIGLGEVERVNAATHDCGSLAPVRTELTLVQVSESHAWVL